MTEIDAGGSATCALLDDSTLTCWGFLSRRPLMMVQLPEQLVATDVLNGVVGVAVGTDHACARKTDGSVWCWGNDDYMQLGDGRSEGYGPVEVTFDGLRAK